MTKIKKIISFYFWLLSAVPAAALAQTTCTGGNCVQQGLTGSGLLNLFGGGGLTAARDVPSLIVLIIQLLLFLAAGVAVLFIIIGGFWYITASGNEEQAEKGRKALVNAIIGVIVIVLSYTIVTVISNTVLGY